MYIVYSMRRVLCILILASSLSCATDAGTKTSRWWSHVAELALEAAGRLVKSEMDGPTQRRLVDDFLSEVTPAEAEGNRN